VEYSRRKYMFNPFVKSVKRKVFYSFHYKKDVMRAAQIRNIGLLEGNSPVSDNEWEKIKKKEREL